jgi:hypothetical protein
MSQRATSALMIAAGLLGALEFVSAIVIWKENYQDAEPLFAVVFGVLFLGGLALVRGGRVVAGAVLVGGLAMFELLTAPSWARHGVLDWISQGIGVAVAAVGLAAAIAAIVTRRSARARLS